MAKSNITDKQKQKILDRAINDAEFGDPITVSAQELPIAKALIKEGKLTHICKRVFEITEQAF